MALTSSVVPLTSPAFVSGFPSSSMRKLHRKNLTNSYYECFNPDEKKAIKEEVSATIRRQIHDRGISVDFGDLALSGNDQFFFWHTWFHDVFSKGGFDIVIWNPPYGVK